MTTRRQRTTYGPDAVNFVPRFNALSTKTIHIRIQSLMGRVQRFNAEIDLAKAELERRKTHAPK